VKIGKRKKTNLILNVDCKFWLLKDWLNGMEGWIAWKKSTQITQYTVNHKLKMESSSLRPVNDWPNGMEEWIALK
jgi:hypothetical protein